MFYSRRPGIPPRIPLKEPTYTEGPPYLNNHCLKIPFLTDVLTVLL
jgi:hypothetical protein